MDVLVLYASSPAGHAALHRARALATEHEARLTVLAVTPLERSDVGCACVRQSAVVFNRELGEIAAEELVEAIGVLGRAPDIAYEIGRGDRGDAVIAVARRQRVDLIILPSRRARVFSRRSTPSQARRIDAAGPWHVGVAPLGRTSRSRDGYNAAWKLNTPTSTTNRIR